MDRVEGEEKPCSAGFPPGTPAPWAGRGMTQNHIGVDLSQDWIDIHDPLRGDLRIANRETAIGDWLATVGRDGLLVFEATSGCDGALLRRATAAGRPFHRINPLHAWHFARSLNLPRTDRVDARMLARLGAERSLEPSPGFDAVQAELVELVGRRDQLKRMATQEKNRKRTSRLALVRTQIEASLQALAAQIGEIERAIARFLAAHPELARKAQLLRSIPSIDRATGAALLAWLPELGGMDRRGAASLGGLAPRARESGKWRGRRRIGDGRRHVRRVLYMAAMSAMKRTSPYAHVVDRMRSKGKAGKLIAIAMARKLLTIANAVLRDNLPFKAA